MMLIGVLWAMLAPLLLAIPVWALHRLLAVVRPAWPARRRLALAAAAVATGVLALWLPARLQFARLCDEIGMPRVVERVKVDGFFLDDSTANSFGMRYLHEEGFEWIEARSIRRRDGYTRYRKTAQGIQSEEIAEPSASVQVSSVLTMGAGPASVQRTVITDRHSGRVLATAGSAHFGGGPARWVLGAYGSASCPNPASPSENAAWSLGYHLAKATLR